MAANSKAKNVKDGAGGSIAIEGVSAVLSVKRIQAFGRGVKALDMTDLADEDEVKVPADLKNYDALSFELRERVNDVSDLREVEGIIKKITVIGGKAVDGSRSKIEFYGFVSKIGGTSYEHGTEPERTLEITLSNITDAGVVTPPTYSTASA